VSKEVEPSGLGLKPVYPVLATTAISFCAATFFSAQMWIIPVLFLVGIFFSIRLIKTNKGATEEVLRGDTAIAELVKHKKPSSLPTHLSEYDCKNYEQTSFEMKLYHEGVIGIQEITTCEDGGKKDNYCLLCRPILAQQYDARQAEHTKSIANAQRATEKAARERDYEQLSAMTEKDAARVCHWNDIMVDKTTTRKMEKIVLCKGCMAYTWFVKFCPKCRLKDMVAQDEKNRLAKIEAEKARKAAKKAEEERLFEERRHINFNGLHLYRPDGVPEGAVPSLLHGREIDPMATHSFIVWKWTEDGKNTKFFKQPVLIDAMTVSVDSTPVKTVYSVTDGDGRYVGDYTVNNNVYPKERHFAAIRKACGDENVKIQALNYQFGE